MVNNLPANVRDVGLIPGSGRSLGRGTGNPLQYSCLVNPMDTGAKRVTGHGITRVRHNLKTKQQTFFFLMMGLLDPFLRKCRMCM